MAKEFLSDVKKLRERARRHIENGAVTDDSTTRRMLEGILAMEEEHADDLASLLATLDPTLARA